MPSFHDGPASPLFAPLPFSGNVSFGALKDFGVSTQMASAAEEAPGGRCTCWGIPFQVGKPVVARDALLHVPLPHTMAGWIVFMHTADIEPLEWNRHGFITASRGIGRLAEHVADYTIEYADGTEAVLPIKRRHHIGMVQRPWGENCFEAVHHRKFFPTAPTFAPESLPPFGSRPYGWAVMQTRSQINDLMPWNNWLWAWENPHPEKAIVGMRVLPHAGTVVISGMAAGEVTRQPLRWDTRKKAILKVPDGIPFDYTFDSMGLLKQLRIDLGQVISAYPRPVYPDKKWATTFNNQSPASSPNEVIVEYTAHPDALFHFADETTLRVADVERGKRKTWISPIAPATQRVRIRVVEKAGKKPVAAKLHIHGAAGEYLAPLDRHRIPNPGWLEDFSPDYVNERRHYCSYIDGETTVDLPLGTIYVEVSKGFEIRPVRKTVDVKPSTQSITLTVDRVLPWRERGWVTADTHVHFLSPSTALLEGAAEGVNVVNLLASQWGEFMTNVGDFDGRTTLGEHDQNGEWLVRVGTEHRQHVLGHISLLGYAGSMITPLCVGGPDESALGDAVNVLMAEWARQCRDQGGLVIMPHFPNPRCENAANLIRGDVDAIEMCSWENLYGGLDPYSLSDWYRYLNCGYFLPAVGGTDKMTTATAVGALRTYTKLPEGTPFTYGAWMEAVKDGHTFVTYGPLLEFRVEGHPSGSRIGLKRTGGTVQVEYEAASVTVPMTRLDLIVNGEIRESKAVTGKQARGHWAVKVDKSAWMALLIRGRFPGKPEMIAAHSSPVMAEVEGSPFFAAADAMTILEQIEGAIAYLDTVGTRAETAAYKRMRLTLTAAHRRLHNELHRQGHDHRHTHAHDHADHHR
ncbi:MAG: hypothetical protein AMXMBFR84_03630 [Candidatus Hydrogenedentota bacterium]